MDCSKELGYKLNNSKSKRCRSCRTLLLNTDPTTNSMYGKLHKNREKFRPKNFSNVNYDDRIEEFSPGGNSRKKYRMSCLQCGVDRGYQTLKDVLRVCKKCRDKNITCYTPEQKRLRSTMKANLVARLKQRLINKNKKSTFDILNYTVDELKEHLEVLFETGMTWDNYGDWEIDHVTPDSWFVYNSMEDKEFQKSWALKNLQPKWKKDNRSKGNRFEG